MFEKQGRGVFLPYEQFQKLWETAAKKTPDRPDATPPADSFILAMSAQATVAKDVVTVDARLQIELLKEGWNEVPIRLGDAAIMSAKMGDGPARLVRNDAKGYSLPFVPF